MATPCGDADRAVFQEVYGGSRAQPGLASADRAVRVGTGTGRSPQPRLASRPGDDEDRLTSPLLRKTDPTLFTLAKDISQHPAPARELCIMPWRQKNAIAILLG